MVYEANHRECMRYHRTPARSDEQRASAEAWHAPCFVPWWSCRGAFASGRGRPFAALIPEKMLPTACTDGSSWFHRFHTKTHSMDPAQRAAALETEEELAQSHAEAGLLMMYLLD